MLDKVEDDCGVFWLDLSLISLDLLRIVSSRLLTRSTIYHIIVPRHPLPEFTEYHIGKAATTIR